MDLSYGQFFEMSLSSQAACKSLFQAIQCTVPDLVPKKFGTSEPLRTRFTLDGVMAAWTESVLWCGTRPQSEGQYWPRDNFCPVDVVQISVDSDAATAPGLIALMQRLGHDFSGHFGYVHLVTDQQVRSPEYKSRIMPFAQGLSWKDATHRLPGLAWGMLFGSTFCDRVGRELLLQSPAHIVSESPSGIYLQVTPDILDVADHYDMFRERVEAITRHLGPEVVAQPNY